MDKTIDANEFALATLSATQLSGDTDEVVEKAFDVYVKAFDKIENHNAPIIKSGKENNENNRKALTKAFLNQ